MQHEPSPTSFGHLIKFAIYIDSTDCAFWASHSAQVAMRRFTMFSLQPSGAAKRGGWPHLRQVQHAPCKLQNQKPPGETTYWSLVIYHNHNTHHTCSHHASNFITSHTHSFHIIALHFSQEWINKHIKTPVSRICECHPFLYVWPQ